MSDTNVLRETFEITTPLTEQTVVLRGYITGRQKQALEAVLFGDTEFNSAGGSTNFRGDTIIRATNLAIEQVVVSVNGETDEVLGRVLDLPEADYTFVKDEVNKIKDGLADPKGSTKSSSDSQPNT